MGLLDEPPPRPARRTARPAALAVLVLGVLAAAGYWLMRPQPKTPPPAHPPGTRPAPGTTQAAAPPGTQSADAQTGIRPPVAAPTTASLRVEADVPGAQVFLDRRFLSVAPAEARNLDPGPHRLNVSAEGYEMQILDLDLAPGPRAVRVSFKEVRLDAFVDAVHKHSLGSCQGRLSATLDGIRYAASKREDVFQAPLGSIEVLEVDYLKKSLRLKLRGGKSYTFGEQAGNPDNLLRFSQAVDKARKALK